MGDLDEDAVQMEEGDGIDEDVADEKAAVLRGKYSDSKETVVLIEGLTKSFSMRGTSSLYITPSPFYDNAKKYM